MIESGGVRANLVVLYCVNLEECRQFYTDLGLDFTTEQHGKGPRHYAAILADGVVFELYPAGPGRETGALRLGFTLACAEGLTPGRHLLTDPDGRVVEVHAT